MASKIRVGDLVKIITGDDKGKTARVVKINSKTNQAYLEGIGEKTRHMKRSLYNPRGGKKAIQVPIDLSKVQLVVDEKTKKASRIGFKTNTDGTKVRLARQANNKTVDTPAKAKKSDQKGAK